MCVCICLCFVCVCVCVCVCCVCVCVRVQANEMLMGGVKLTATEACERGLVTRVYPQSEFQQKLTENAQHIASLPPMVHTLYITWTLLYSVYVCVCVCMCVCVCCVCVVCVCAVAAKDEGSGKEQLEAAVAGSERCRV